MEELKPAGIWVQTGLLIQKNLKTKRREEKMKLVGELLIPILYLALISYIVSTMSIKTYPKETTEYDKPTDVVYPYGVLGGDIHVAPDNEFVQNLTAIMNQKYKLRNQGHESLTFKYYNNTEELEEAYRNGHAYINVALLLPKENGGNFSYIIRMNPGFEYAPSVNDKKTTLSTCRGEPNNVLEQPETCPVNKYFSSMFLGIQTLVEETLKYVRNPSVEGKLEVLMQNYPKEEFCEGMPSLMRVLVPVNSIIPLVQIINNLLVLIVTEKENKVKDGLRMVGASDLAYWMSWLGMYGLIAMVLALAYAIIFDAMNVIKGANPILLFILVLLFGLSGISFSFTLTPFFHKPKTAGLVGTLLLQVTSLLFILQTFVGEATKTVLIPLKLISSVAFTTALDEACGLICTGGIGFSDLYPGGRGGGTFWSLIFLVFDIFLYTLLAMYLDNVIPNEYGVRQHPLFFLRRGTSDASIQNDRAQLLNATAGPEGSISDTEDDGSVERVSAEIASRRKIVIKDVSKTYTSWFSKDSVEAVQGVSMEVYEGQITAILGKNGAGKSTLLNILAGLVTITAGQAVILGLDASNPADMTRLRKKLGVCLQTDLHFQSLTVEEHLIFYAKLRGVPAERLEKEVSSIIDELDLKDKKDVTSAALSGGQKRKLSVGIALIGNPQIILLDEPTAGFDPVSRRHLWSLLQHKKENRIILLTTHFMDEADVLADRKAIVHGGALKCLGSSLFLKNKYGVGYYLTLEMTNPVSAVPKVDNIIGKWVPEAMDTRKIIGNEVKYALPQSEVSKFSSILQEVEQLIETKQTCKSYGVSMTSLEDVFLKISSDVDVNAGKNNTTVEQEHNLVESCGELRRNQMDILMGLCLLRLKRLWRSPQALFFLIFMPIMFLVIGLLLLRAQASYSGIQTLDISSPKAVYPDLKLAVHESNTSELLKFIKGIGIDATSYSGNYEEILNIYPGEGTAAAITVLAEDQLTLNRSLKALMRINGTYLHIPGVVLNLLKMYFDRLTPDSESSLKYQTFASNNDGLLLQTSVYSVFLLGPVYVFAFVGMVMEVVRDRELKVRDHLRINGLSFGVYFNSIFAVFGGLSLLVTLLLIVLIWVFPIQAFANFYASFILIIILSLFIFPALLFSAAFSYCFNKMDSAQSIFSQIVSWSSTVLGIAILLLDNFVTSRTIVHIVHLTAAMLDVFYIPVGLFYYMNKQYLVASSSKEDINFEAYNVVEIWGLCVVLLVQIPLFWSLLVFADVVKNGGSVCNALRTFWLGRPSEIDLSPAVHSQEDEEVDEDIAEEKDRVKLYMSGSFGVDVSKCVVAVEGIHKAYKVKNVVRPVIRGVDFMVEEAEIFGLLGHNGAGKTTLMKIITAEEAPNNGNVKLCNQNITSNLSTAFHQLGFCPQHDALWENITIREHLMFYATMRGIGKDLQTSVADHFLRGLQIEEHGDKYSQTLSGGTKRKLSYAMSMLGNPRIVLLDEPSTGMDPQSKRFLWNTVLGSFKEKRGAILTTHSMEEADVLCSRIAIMVKGQLLCIGSPQHLKTKYGTGYTMEIKVKAPLVVVDIPPEIDGSLNTIGTPMRRLVPGTSSRKFSSPEAVTLPEQFKFIREYFPAAEMVENFGDRGIFSIPTSGISTISQAFAVLESLKGKHDIEEYSFSQTSLEQVFLSFAKYNEEDATGLDGNA